MSRIHDSGCNFHRARTFKVELPYDVKDYNGLTSAVILKEISETATYVCQRHQVHRYVVIGDAPADGVDSELIESIVDNVIREEWGGAHPGKEDIVKLRAKIENNTIYVFAVGKWRTIRHYPSKRIPSKKIQQEVVSTIDVNTGRMFSKNNKKIELTWESV